MVSKQLHGDQAFNLAILKARINALRDFIHVPHYDGSTNYTRNAKRLAARRLIQLEKELARTVHNDLLAV